MNEQIRNLKRALREEKTFSSRQKCKPKHVPESSSGPIIHAIANAVNTISTVVQLQQRYLTQDPEQMRQLITETTRDLKDELERFEVLLGELHGILDTLTRLRET